MATRILLGLLVFVGVMGAIKDFNRGHQLGEIMMTDFVFIAVGALGLWIMGKDKMRW